jgi:hypothetical protein
VVHQLLEYVLAGVLVEVSLHTRRAGLPLAGAAAFVLLASTARGPLGMARVLGGKPHAVADVGVALALAAAPLVPALRPDALGIVAIEVIAVMWLRVATLTRYAPFQPSPLDASESPVPSTQGGRPGAPAAAPVAASTAMARTLGLFAARTARRRAAPRGDFAEQARRAGRRAGRMHRTWRARERP